MGGASVGKGQRGTDRGLEMVESSVRKGQRGTEVGGDGGICDWYPKWSH